MNLACLAGTPWGPFEENLDCPGAPFAPYVPLVDPKWSPTGSPLLPTTILSTYLVSSWILSISLTPFWSIFDGINFRI